MARNRFRTILIFLFACFVACEPGCTSKTRQEHSAEQTEPRLESAGEENLDFTTPRNTISRRNAFLDVPFAEAGTNNPSVIGPNNDQERRLRISVRGFASKTGNCRIAIYSTATSFNQPEKAALRAVLPIEGDAIVWEPSEQEGMILPAEVVVAAFQDANENEKLDKNSLGIPTERYGFSNNPKRGFGPPSFQQAKITLSVGINALDIEIR